MAKEHSKLQARSCKEKHPNNASRNKKRKKHRRNRKTSPRQSTPLLQRHNGDSWVLSKELLNTFTPIHNHFIGSLTIDTLDNVSAGIGTLAALLSLERERGILASDLFYGAYWLALNMMEALQFEIQYRQKLVATPSEAPPSENHSTAL